MQGVFVICEFHCIEKFILLKTEDLDLGMELLLQRCSMKLVELFTKTPDGVGYMSVNREI